MNWNSAANSNGPQFNGRFLFAANRPAASPFKATRYNLLSQPPFSKPDEESGSSIFNLNDDKKRPLFASKWSPNPESEQDYRSRLNALKYQALLENMSSDPGARLFSSRIGRPSSSEQPTDDRLLLSEKANAFKSLFNRPLDEIINRKTRSDQSFKQRAPLDEYQQSKLLNFLNGDLFHAFRRNLYSKNEEAPERQSQEIVEVNSRTEKKTDDLSRGESNKNRSSAKELEDKSKQLVANGGSYLPVIEPSQTGGPSKPSSGLLRKNKWNRQTKSAGSFRRSNVSDCIKNCVSQGILHPVQCHSLC